VQYDSLLIEIPPIHRVGIVAGGLFPRTAIILRTLCDYLRGRPGWSYRELAKELSTGEETSPVGSSPAWKNARLERGCRWKTRCHPGFVRPAPSWRSQERKGNQTLL